MKEGPAPFAIAGGRVRRKWNAGEDRRFKARPPNTLPSANVAVLPIMSTDRFYGALRPGARLIGKVRRIFPLVFELK